MKKTRHLTEEHKRKISEAQIGKKLSNEHKQKIKNTLINKGIKPSVIFYAIGEEHPSYKNGTGIYRRIYQENKNNLNTCEMCKETNCKIYIHHIDKNRKNNNIDNLIGICGKCHEKIHQNGFNTQYKKGHKQVANSGSFKKGNNYLMRLKNKELQCMIH